MTDTATLLKHLQRCVTMLDALIVESGRTIEHDEEDRFRMGEWFDKEELEHIAEARNVANCGNTQGRPQDIE